MLIGSGVETSVIGRPPLPLPKLLNFLLICSSAKGLPSLPSKGIGPCYQQFSNFHFRRSLLLFLKTLFGHLRYLLLGLFFPPPPWDLDKVLQFLSGPPFEPLARASFLDKTKKALFLLAMATAKRVSELQALSFSVSFQGEDLVLYYDPFFRAKTESAANPLPRSVIVPSLSDFAGDLPERVQCPVRAVKFLRKAARSASYIPSRLFVSPRNPELAMSKNAMSFYLRQLIVDSGAVSSSRHSIITVISLFPTLCKLLRGSRTVSSLPGTLRRSLPPRIISSSSALWSLLGIGCIPGPHSINIRLLFFYSPLASSESEF